MNTNDRICLPRSVGRIASTTLGAIALSLALFACTTPVEPEANEETGTASEALANTGGGGTGSTCESRWQSCYISCGALYGLKDPNTQAQCEALCDEIHTGCSGGFARPVEARPILGVPPVSIAH